jgi:hypothetical protein
MEDQQLNSRLAEYQLCQQSVSYHEKHFWSITGIFIAFSLVLLSAFIFGLISNEALFHDVTHIKFFEAYKEVVVIRALVTIIGIIIISIYIVLWRWLQRVRHLQQTNYRRMREIEIESGMHIGLLITGVDEWNRLTKEEKQYLTALGKGEGWCKKQRECKSFVSPTFKVLHKAFFALLVLLWLVVVPSIWFVYWRYYKYILIILIVLYVLGFVYWSKLKCWWQQRKQKVT